MAAHVHGQPAGEAEPQAQAQPQQYIPTTDWLNISNQSITPDFSTDDLQSPNSFHSGYDGDEAMDEAIEIDQNYLDDDGDSAIDAGSMYSDTTSLKEEMTRYRFENYRRYHAFKDGEYWAPNDEKQNNQLDIEHHLFLVTMYGKLFLAPIEDKVQRVLDVGTGTGIWAIEFADLFPTAEVIGFDLSPIQPSWVSPNLHFEINDALSDDWGYRPESFDFIHVRGMYGSVADWPAFYRHIWKHCAPGGYIEQVELSVDPTSDDGSVTHDNIFAEWGRVSLEMGERFGKTFRIHERMKGYIEEAGFEDVVEVAYKMPIGPWSKESHMKQVGMWNLLDWQEGCEGWCVAHLTRAMGWTYTEVQNYLARVREGLKNRKIHAYQYLKVVYARKPGGKDDIF